MSDKPYYKLREFLDTFSLGFPQTASGVEIKILKKLFTQAEAQLVLQLSPVPEEAAQIAQRTGMNEDKLVEKLESMSKKGLIFRLQREGKTFYNAAPFMIGLYEYSVKRIDDELAGLFKEYYDTAYQKEMGASNIPGFKVIPVEETIAADMVLLPYHKIKEDIRSDWSDRSNLRISPRCLGADLQPLCEIGERRNLEGRLRSPALQPRPL